MATVFRWVDPEDYSSVRLDMKSLIGSPTQGFDLVADVDLGGVPTETYLIDQPPLSGASVGYSRAPVAKMGFRLLARATSVDNFRILALSLATECARGGIIEFQPNGATASRFYEIYPSPLPQLARGQELAMVELVSMLQTASGLPVELLRHPWSRRALVAGTPTAVTNGVNARELAVSNPGNAPALLKISVTPESGAKFGQARIALRSKGNLTEFGTSYAFECEGATLYSGTDGDTSSGTTATGYSGTGAALTTFTNIDSLARRWRKKISPSDGTALEGMHRIRCRIKPYAGGGSTLGTFKVQARWGTADVHPVQFSNNVVELDYSDIDSLDWIEVDLGDIAIGKGSGDVVIEFWASRVDGDYKLASDMVTLYPSDEAQTVVAVPGIRTGHWGRMSWRGDELSDTPALGGETGGDTRENSARVNEQDETMTTPPDAGFKLSAGVYKASIKSTVYIDDATKGTKTTVGKFEVLDDDGGWAVRKSVKLQSRKNRTSVDRNRDLTFTVTSGDESGGVKFLLRAKQTGTTQDGRKILIHRISLSFIRTITENDALVIDGNSKRVYVADESSGESLWPVLPEGTHFIEAPPGNSTLVFQWGDIPTDPGYHDVDYREPHARITATRSCDVTVDVIPRDTD